MKLTSVFEGKTTDGEYIVTVRPPMDAPVTDEIVDYYVHFVPELLEDQRIHDPSTECYCMPSISILDRPNVPGVVWKVQHRQVVRKTKEPNDKA